LKNQKYKSVVEFLAFFFLLKEADSGLNTPVLSLLFIPSIQEEWASFLMSDHLNSLSLGAGSIGFQPWNVEFLWSSWHIVLCLDACIGGCEMSAFLNVLQKHLL